MTFVRRRSVLVTALITALVVVAAPREAGAATTSSPADGSPFADVNGLHATGFTTSTVTDTAGASRTVYDVGFSTAKVVYSGSNVSSANPEEPPPGAVVVLPANYASRPTVRFPVIYLFTGGSVSGTAGDAQRRMWTDPVNGNGDNGDAVNLTAGRDAIVVSVEGGRTGTYTNWVRPGTGDQSKFEDFHVGQVIPWVDANFRTRATREGRALAGLSAGGLGAFGYLARHPEMFVTAGSFSGAIDTTNIYEQQLLHAVSVAATGGQDGDAILGRYNDVNAFSHDSEQLNYRKHNPFDLVGNYKGMRLALFAGTGVLTPEPDLRTIAQQFVPLAQAAGATVSYQDETCAHCSHEWQNWRQALSDYLPIAMATFAAPPPTPSTWSYKSGEQAYSAWGWSVTTANAYPEFTTLARTSTGFTLTGSGTAAVTTAPSYVPGSAHTVKITPQGGSTATRSVTADAQGRLAVISFTIGPPNTQPDYTNGAQPWSTATPNPYRTTTVTIT